mmetsp:Transcript_27358/g.47241  ORF Transcript_27358/g.47241 Transcript_27358/m.47241 type:complete len:232 (-) Transcript_27358:397-1092(-)
MFRIWSILIGLGMWSSIPDARHLSLSASDTLAVTAQMKLRREVLFCSSPSRIRRVASYPSHTGIWQSMRMTSKSSAALASTASAPFETILYRQPTFFRTRSISVWLIGWSSAQRTLIEDTDLGLRSRALLVPVLTASSSGAGWPDKRSGTTRCDWLSDENGGGLLRAVNGAVAGGANDIPEGMSEDGGVVTTTLGDGRVAIGRWAREECEATETCRDVVGTGVFEVHCSER